MEQKPQMKISLLLATAALSIGVFSLRAEEASEHLMTTIGGTQISGYVSTTASWIHQPVFALGPLLPPVAPFTGSTLGPSPLISWPSVFIEVNRIVPPADFPPLPPPSYSDVSIPSVSEVAPRVHWAPGSSSVELAAVPEPATISLLGLGAAAMFARLRRKKQG